LTIHDWDFEIGEAWWIVSLKMKIWIMNVTLLRPCIAHSHFQGITQFNAWEGDTTLLDKDEDILANFQQFKQIIFDIPLHFTSCCNLSPSPPYNPSSIVSKMQANCGHSLHLWCINPIGFQWPFFFLSAKFDTVTKKN
jgi:hypothetical protein